MEQLCKDLRRIAITRLAEIAVTSLSSFRVAMSCGALPRKEGFVCSFDPDGQFLHLSMR
jgi:hypothetical protein